jgi:hypothetical protein
MVHSPGVIRKSATGDRQIHDPGPFRQRDSADAGNAKRRRGPQEQAGLRKSALEIAERIEEHEVANTEAEAASDLDEVMDAVQPSRDHEGSRGL